MIKAGTSFCYRCGSTFQDTYYKSGAKAVGAILRHPKISLGKIAWELEPFTPGGSEQDSQEQLTLVDVSGGDDGMPDFIHVRFSDDSVHEMKRCCPFCKDDSNKYLNTQLPVDSGRYPTYVIAMVGERTVGKTTWLQSVANEQNLAMVNSVDAFPCKLEFIYKNPIVDTPPGATAVGATGKTNYLRIIDKAANRTVASVILRDAAGELYNQINNDDCYMRKFLFGSGKYPGVDAIMYFESAVSYVDEIKNQADLSRMQNEFAVYEAMERANALGGKYIAYVCTHTDEMLKNKRRIPKTQDYSGEHQVALYTESTFRGGNNYEPGRLLDRMAQQDVICRAMGANVLINADHTRRGFMIQSCQDIKLEDGTTINDMTKNFNLMDPLLWLLNQLRLFPIPQA